MLRAITPALVDKFKICGESFISETILTVFFLVPTMKAKSTNAPWWPYERKVVQGLMWDNIFVIKLLKKWSENWYKFWTILSKLVYQPRRFVYDKVCETLIRFRLEKNIQEVKFITQFT